MSIGWPYVPAQLAQTWFNSSPSIIINRTPFIFRNVPILSQNHCGHSSYTKQTKPPQNYPKCVYRFTHTHLAVYDSMYTHMYLLHLSPCLCSHLTSYFMLIMFFVSAISVSLPMYIHIDSYVSIFYMCVYILYMIDSYMYILYIYYVYTVIQLLTKNIISMKYYDVKWWL